jgi:hypothetical protein
MALQYMMLRELRSATICVKNDLDSYWYDCRHIGEYECFQFCRGPEAQGLCWIVHHNIWGVHFRKRSYEYPYWLIDRK